MPKSVTETLDDPKFRSLSPQAQRIVLGKLGISDDMQGKLLAKISNSSGASTSTYTGPTRVVRPPMKDKEYHDVLGSMDPNSFSSRVGERIKQTASFIPNALDYAQTSKAIKEKVARGEDLTRRERELYTQFSSPEVGKANRDLVGANDDPLTQAGKLATIAPRMAIQQGVEYWNDPAKLVGDLVLASPELTEAKAASSAKAAAEAESKAPIPHGEGSVPEHLRRLTDKQRAEYTEALDKANRDHAQALIDHAEKESKARAKWVETAYKAKKSVADSVAADNKRQILETGSREYARLVKDNVESTHTAVRSALDQRWNTMREEMRGTTISQPEDIYNGIRGAENEYLRGAPESLQQFRALIKEMGLDSFVENEDGSLLAAPGEQKPLDWETGRVHYSAIGDKLASGNLPGNVYQALKSVHSLLDEKLGQAAVNSGRGAEYGALKSDWSEYMRDWRNTGAVSTGGSPLAKLMQVPDIGNVQSLVTGKAADRLLSTLGKYRRFGAKPELSSMVRHLQTEIERVPKVKVRDMPSKYEPPKAPEIRDVRPPKVAPEPYKMSGGKKAAIKLTSRGAGLLGGMALGHPIIGYGGGEIAGEAVVRSIEKRRNAALSKQVPEDIILPWE